MLLFLKGILYLVLVLAVFSLFTFKMPHGEKAMSGLAAAAVATFLVEAVYRYVGGDFAGIDFLGSLGTASGSMGGVAAVILVMLTMGAAPVYAVAAGVALMGFGILPGFIAGYILYFVSRFIETRLPEGVNIIIGALVLSVAARGIAVLVDPGVTFLVKEIGEAIMIATEQSPLAMGFILGGLMKIICTSPLSSMALTAMISLTGMPMGIAALACFGGSFTNGVLFSRLKLGNKANVAAVMIEPLTQAPIITKNPIPIYASDFLGGGLSGIVAVMLGIINDAPGTASPLPGMLSLFAFNDIKTVLLALLLAAVCGLIAGFAGSAFFGRFYRKKEA